MAARDAIEIADLTVTRGGREVVRGVSVSVASGSVTGLLGPSGCGKTTLMRAVVGVQLQTAGRVTVLGEPAGSASVRRRVGYVTQAPSVYGDLSIDENLRYFAAIVDVSTERIDEILATVGLVEARGQLVASLSGGQRSRVSLAAAPRYGIAFGTLAAAQAVVVCGTGFLLLGLSAPHGAWLVGLLAVANALLGMALGLFLSAFARTEFQAVQFMPAFVLPQLLLCGLFVDREEMAGALHAVSWVLPFTYAYDALARVTRPGALGAALAIDAAVILLATVGALAFGAVTLRRRTP